MTEETAPRFLSVAEVLDLHQESITLYGGASGMRDAGLLESAVDGVQQTFGGKYLYPTLWEMAAAYWYGLTKNHPFVDGNKRIGAFACDVFLATNGYDLRLSAESIVDITRRIATSSITREEVAQIVYASVIPPFPPLVEEI